MIQELGTYIYHPHQRKRFKSGELVDLWYSQYPHLFDELDKSQADSQAKLGYHFYEWLAIVLLHESTGYLCLLEKYGFKKHRRKQEIFRNIVSPEVFELVMDKKYSTQTPDLFMYAPDFSDWFFCEVKGPNDDLSEKQIEYFNALSEASGKTIYTLYYRELKP